MRAYIASLLFAVMVFAAPLGANAAKQEATYDVYAGGIHALQARLTIDTSTADHYHIELKAKTYGLLGKLVPWQGTFETYGWRSGASLETAEFKPKLHRSIALWRGEEEIKSYRYNKDGTFQGIEILETGKKPRKKSPDSKLTDHTTDVLSATLEALAHYVQEGSCGYEADIFDGKRRFTQKFTPKKQEQLKKSRYNIYEGNAASCAVEVVPKGGAWHKKPRGWMSIQEQGRAKGTMPTVWFGRVKEADAAVPVKILVKTNYGSLFMHLTDYKTTGRVKVAQQK